MKKSARKWGKVATVLLVLFAVMSICGVSFGSAEQEKLGVIGIFDSGQLGIMEEFQRRVRGFTVGSPRRQQGEQGQEGRGKVHLPALEFCPPHGAPRIPFRRESASW